MKKDKKNQWKFVLVGIILSVSMLFSYMGRTQEGISFLIVAIVLFVLALLILHWIDKMGKN